jgi:predicted PurR-regulated permease PerM
VLIIPSFSFSAALIDSIKELTTTFDEGKLVVPPPADKVAEWPIIGEKTHDIWQTFSDNTKVGIEQYRDEIAKIGTKFIDLLKSFASSLLVFVLAIIIAGIFLSNSKGGFTFVSTLFTALIGDKGEEMLDNTKKTISSVVTGVLGTAVIQTTIIVVALFVFKVPAAPIFSLIILFMAIAQIPVAIIIIPLIIYMFSAVGGTSALLFAIWTLVGALSDNFIKPLLLGRGMEIPMVIILIGAIGGMLAMGIIGLFIGAVILALGYQLFQLWINSKKEERDNIETNEI